MLEVTDVTVKAACNAPLAKEPLGQSDAEHLAIRLKALADPARLRLLSIVASSEEQEACVCNLVEPVGLSQPTVSHHLKVLTAAVQILIGEKDLAPGPVAAAELVTLFRRAFVTVLPGTAHFPWVDQPGAFATAVAAALTDHPAK